MYSDAVEGDFLRSKDGTQRARTLECFCKVFTIAKSHVSRLYFVEAM